MTTEEFWWTGLVLTLVGAALTTSAAVWTFMSARRQRAALDRAWGQREALREEWVARSAELRSAYPNTRDGERIRRPLENELQADYLARMDALVPSVATRLVDSGTHVHFARSQALSDAIAGFWRQGLMALAGVWLGTAGAVCSLLSAPPH